MTTLEQSKSELLTKAVRPAPSSQGHRRAARRRGPAGAAQALLPPRRARGPRRPRPRSTSTAPCWPHYKLAADAPAGHRAASGCSRPTRLGQRLVGRRAHRRRGRHRRHAVPRRLADDGAVPRSCATSTWSSTRSFDVGRDITGALQSVRAVAGRRARAPTGDAVRESWMHVEIDRIPEGDDLAAIDRATSSACSATSARPSRTGSKMHAQVAGDRRRARASDPPPLPTPRRSRRAAALLRVAGRRPLHLPRLPRVPPRARRRRRAAARRPRHRPRHPARRPGHVARRSAGCPTLVKAKAREKTLLVLTKANSRVDRAPPGLPRLRRREDVRRRTAR